MKRILVAFLASAVLLVLAGSTSVSALELSAVDIDTDTGGNAVVYTFSGAGGNCSSFNPERPGTWGSEFGEGAVTAFPGDDAVGHCRLRTGGASAASLELRVLDGIADDSFEVRAKKPGGKWTLVHAYTADPSTAEVWKVHTMDVSSVAGSGSKAEDVVMVNIVPTNLGWSGFDTWGQLAVDYIKMSD